MRISPLAIALLAPTAAFTAHHKGARTSSLEAHKTNYANHVIGVFAGMTLGSGVAFAALPPLPTQGMCLLNYLYLERGGLSAKMCLTVKINTHTTYVNPLRVFRCGDIHRSRTSCVRIVKPDVICLWFSF